MPVTWIYDGPPMNIATLTIEAPYTIETWRRAMDAILASAAPDNLPLRFLVDRRKAGAPTVADAKQIIQYFCDHATQWHGARAAVVAPDDLAYGMARLVAIRTELAAVRLRLEVFREIDDAIRWLFHR